MKKYLKCPNCGNKSKFYRNVNIAAKQRINKYGEELSMIYDVDKSKIDNSFDDIYCCNCDELVLQEDESL